MKAKIGRMEQDAIDRFVESCTGGSIYHTSRIGDVIRKTFGHETLMLTEHDHGTIVGVLPLVHMRSRIFGNFLVSMPFFNYGGVCTESDAAAEALLRQAIEIADKRECQHIELRHMHRRFAELSARTTKVAMVLDLPETAEALWQQFKSKLRSQIRRPEKEGVTIRIGRFELIEPFYEVFSHNMRDLGTPVYTRRLFSNMLAAFPGNSWIVAAFLQGKPLAAGFLLGFRDTIEIPWASSLRAYNRLAANMLMYWEALKLAINEGYRRFDFGRCTQGEGTYKFKAQWGAQPIQLHWEYWLANGESLPDLSPKNAKYQMAIRIWQKLPLPLTRFIGPPIVRNIP